MGQVSVYNLSGGNGSVYVTTADAQTGDFFAIQFLADSQIDAITGNMENSSALISDNHVFTSGQVVYGRFSSITLDSAAKAILYKA